MKSKLQLKDTDHMEIPRIVTKLRFQKHFSKCNSLPNDIDFDPKKMLSFFKSFNHFTFNDFLLFSL